MELHFFTVKHALLRALIFRATVLCCTMSAQESLLIQEYVLSHLSTNSQKAAFRASENNPFHLLGNIALSKKMRSDLRAFLFSSAVSYEYRKNNIQKEASSLLSDEEFDYAPLTAKMRDHNNKKNGVFPSISPLNRVIRTAKWDEMHFLHNELRCRHERPTLQELCDEIFPFFGYKVLPQKDGAHLLLASIALRMTSGETEQAQRVVNFLVRDNPATHFCAAESYPSIAYQAFLYMLSAEDECSSDILYGAKSWVFSQHKGTMDNVPSVITSIPLRIKLHKSLDISKTIQACVSNLDTFRHEDKEQKNYKDYIEVVSEFMPNQKKKSVLMESMRTTQ